MATLTAPLTDDQRSEIREKLTANADTRAGQAWKGRDIDTINDAELIAFNAWTDSLKPLEKGLTCSCGRKHVHNFETATWKETGTPKPVKTPGSVEEFIANGGGTQEDKEAWNVAKNVARARRNEVLERLTANMEEAKRTTFWDKHQQSKIEDLEEMLELLPKQHQEQRQPTANFYGQQGPPPGSPVTNVHALIPPTLDFQPRKTG